MKASLFLLMVLFATSAAFAQLSAGSVRPLLSTLSFQARHISHFQLQSFSRPDTGKASPRLYQPMIAEITHAGFFCRQELQMDKKNKTQFRFRLGSLDYVDRLEGKR